MARVGVDAAALPRAIVERHWAGVDDEIRLNQLKRFRLLPLGLWGAFMEDASRLRQLFELVRSAQKRGSRSGRVGVWMSYLPGSRKTRPMSLVIHRDVAEMANAVGDTNVAHVAAVRAM